MTVPLKPSKEFLATVLAQKRAEQVIQDDEVRSSSLTTTIIEKDFGMALNKKMLTRPYPRLPMRNRKHKFLPGQKCFDFLAGEESGSPQKEQGSATTADEPLSEEETPEVETPAS